MTEWYLTEDVVVTWRKTSECVAIKRFTLDEVQYDMLRAECSLLGCLYFAAKYDGGVSVKKVLVVPEPSFYFTVVA